MEARFGRFWFAVLYLGGGFAASAVHLVIHPDSAEPVVGASGAIAGVLAAYAMTYPAASVLTIVPIWIIPFFIPIPAIIFALIWFALQVVQGSYELALPDMGGGVAWWAHIGGFAFGALFAFAADHAGLGMQTQTRTWSHTRGRRVPNVRPSDLDRHW
jgi:membrane associated rhomboid family serine protease